MNIQMKRYTGQGLGGSRVQEHLSPWSWGVPPSRCIDVFANLEAFRTPHY